MRVLQQHGSIRCQARRGPLSNGQAARRQQAESCWQSERQMVGACHVAHLPASEASLQECTAGHCIGDLYGEPHRLSRAACVETACPGSQTATNFGLLQPTHCLALPAALSIASMLALLPSHLGPCRACCSPSASSEPVHCCGHRRSGGSQRGGGGLLLRP